MAEYTTSATQTVVAGQNVRFTETTSCSKNCCNIMHSQGSGVVTLRGSNSCCNPAKYRVSFGGNIAVAAGGTVGPISVAIALNGEPIYGATATVTPASIGDFFNVYASTIITIPCNCCLTVAVENVSTPATPIDVANATIAVTREC